MGLLLKYKLQPDENAKAEMFLVPAPAAAAALSEGTAPQTRTIGECQPDGRERRERWRGIPSSMSLENLLRILPVGVVSKNFIGLRRILRKSSSWSREEARSVPCGAERGVSGAQGPAPRQAPSAPRAAVPQLEGAHGTEGGGGG